MMKPQIPKPKVQSFGFAARLNFYVKAFIFLVLLFWLVIFMAEKIDLATADLGRHIENGRWIVENHFDLREKNSPVHENFYSYTHPDFGVVNHHWAGGVIFYFIYKIFGFFGLSFFYICLSLLTFAVLFQVAKKESDFFSAVVLSLFLIPLISERREIRPEVFSVFLASLFYFVLWKYKRGEISRRWLWVLPVLMLFWINLHVYFFLGFFFIAAFLIVEVWKVVFFRLDDFEFLQSARRAKDMVGISIVCTIAALFNPFGWKGLVYPLGIFKNYEYTIVENKSVWFVENYGIANSNFLLVKIVLVLLVVSFVILLISNRKQISAVNLILAVFFGLMGWFAIRNFTLLGFFALPILAANTKNIFLFENESNGEKRRMKEEGLTLFFIVVFVFSLFCSWQFAEQHWKNRGFGLLPGVNAAADFLKNHGVKGPIFNDYDIGGYLIFNLPDQKVFVDNRPAEYPGNFFTEVYKPMQENMEIFEKIDEEYNFNAVVFYRNDITPWAQNFLGKIKENENWAPVFADNHAIIYLKRNDRNRELINKYKM